MLHFTVSLVNRLNQTESAVFPTLYLIMIIIITSLFTEDNILSTYKHLSNIWSSFKTNYTVIHKTHIYNTNTNIYS